jgi:hypothetical protein
MLTKNSTIFFCTPEKIKKTARVEIYSLLTIFFPSQKKVNDRIDDDKMWNERENEKKIKQTDVEHKI